MVSFGSLCSGIEAASVSWGKLGFKAAWFSEIEPFPSALLHHRYPDVPNLGNMELIADKIRNNLVEIPDILCGGTPCQAFSVGGLKNSLKDPRGALSLKFCEIANEIDKARVKLGKQPSIIMWENVVGALRTKDNAFGCFLAGLAGEDQELQPPGGKWANSGCVFGPQRTVAWRVLDSQYFGVPQRRKRVFVIATTGDSAAAVKILFEPQDSSRYYKKVRVQEQDNTKRTPTHLERVIPKVFERHDQDARIKQVHVCPTIGAQADNVCDLPIVLEPRLQRLCDTCGGDGCEDCSNTGVQVYDPYEESWYSTSEELPMSIRRFTPLEIERMFGFPDNYTKIPWKGKNEDDCPDGLRLKSVGNSWAIPVIAWIGERIKSNL